MNCTLAMPYNYIQSRNVAMNKKIYQGVSLKTTLLHRSNIASFVTDMRESLLIGIEHEGP
jgi:hypothetical protein